MRPYVVSHLNAKLQNWQWAGIYFFQEKSRNVSDAEQVARGREAALLAHPQNDRHEDQDDRRLIDKHRKGGGDRQYRD